ncbi:uncharacterized protein BKA55DRAFT_554094 [Fusarium redolens]|uniref:Uncharacterized protein n=1 Tax=Fusarium redolens TaxID=48865 RepID=A0A9P9R428_FUSRE|nr:uncharacterized protein BKA55DRAFT_554094 [Fusarium redolens]KAH7267021.1 hypothetical protein BKA55DRAFT_554094 [Fusarium redolens]
MRREERVNFPGSETYSSLQLQGHTSLHVDTHSHSHSNLLYHPSHMASFMSRNTRVLRLTTACRGIIR